MPLAVHLLGIHTAAPLVAMSALTLNIINVIRYRQSLDFSEIKRLGLLTVLGIPVGVWALGNLDELRFRPRLNFNSKSAKFQLNN